jgi:hypothetical protein
LSKGFGEWLIELKQKLGFRLLDSPSFELGYRFADGFFI